MLAQLVDGDLDPPKKDFVGQAARLRRMHPLGHQRVGTSAPCAVTAIERQASRGLEVLVGQSVPNSIGCIRAPVVLFVRLLRQAIVTSCRFAAWPRRPRRRQERAASSGRKPR
ncbi:MAG: hypothetical protein R3E88_03985 [Myxococcota bacterium]